ncbi:hypothetical protein JM946_18200 [Steroidobacter sp. S1-65]|uniref:Secreted protein n=1 Tax=Steroidobacter gossypii TaxID=2805490 RepID=A0ABS1X0E4_9GAMM|nr:hypothetical protein [Steroidobacter gossypii]MBM0106667.1 hypothetical protein [Steroidobacter gossypii]
MKCKYVLATLLAGAFSMSAGAADPTNSTLLKQCESAQGEVKRECEDVAKQMLRKDQEGQQRSDQTDQQVTHSSPAMETPSDAKQKSAQPSAKPTPKPSKPKPE